MTIEQINEFLTTKLPIGYEVTYGQLVSAVLIIIGARVLFWAFKVVIKRRVKRDKLEKGNAWAIVQIVKYISIIVTILLVFEAVGINITLLLAGSAALLVGIGLGVQEIFKDLLSGILLLVEGTVAVGDIIEAEGIVGRVESIELRKTNIVTRDNISIIVPNNKLVTHNVINWSHNKQASRFKLVVGVAYGSDVELVKQLLEQAAKEHPNTNNERPTLARFYDFGDSALVFELLFYTNNMFIIENIKSDIRFAIDRLFRQHNITIPFPQRDVHHYGLNDMAINKNQ